MVKVKKIPQRMCVGCQTMKPKRELIRVVRTPEGKVEIDGTGKRAGRGAYICRNAACLQKAIKEKKLEKALEIPLPPETVDLLKQGLSE